MTGAQGKPPSIARGAAANVAGRVWLIVVNLAVVPIYLRLLGVEAYGLVGVLLGFQAIMSIMDVGLGPTLTRALARRARTGDPGTAGEMHDWVRTVSSIVALTNAAFAVVVALSSNWLAHNWFNPKTLDVGAVAHSIQLMGVVVAAQFFSNLCTNGIQAVERQGLANLVNSGGTTLRAVATVLALLGVTRSVQVFFIAQAAATSLQALAAFMTLRAVLPHHVRRSRFDLSLLTPEWRFALGSTGISLVSLAVNHIDKVVVTRFFPLSEFGYYSISSSLAAATPILVTPVVQACYPRLCAMHAAQDESALRGFYRLASQWITVALAAPTATVVVFAPEVLLAWTGDAEVAGKAARIAIWLTLGYFLNGAMNAPYALNLAYGKTRLFLIANAISAVLLVPAMALLVPRFGAAGASLGWLAYSAASLMVVAPLAHRGTLPSETWRWPLQDVLLPALGALAGAFAVRLIPWPGEGGFRVLALLRAAIGFTFALVAALLVSRKAATSVMHAFKSRLVTSRRSRT
ncbi:MAG: oligosaccharide flippase family protein [Verrucomicrobiota bacterium]